MRLQKFRPGRRHRISDAHGRVVCLCEVSDLPDDADAALRRSVRVANEHRLVPVISWFLAAMAGMLIFRYLFTAAGCRRLPANAPPFPADSPERILWTVIAAMLVFVPITLLWYRRKAKLAAVAAIDACLGACLCPSCCYPLSARDADDVATCTECGSAWFKAGWHLCHPPS
jgi:hypothetical protein